jgi:molecular chaperone GrpE
MSDRAPREGPRAEPAAQPPVRDSGPGEGDRGNREVSPAPSAARAESEPNHAEQQEEESLEHRLEALTAERDEYMNHLQRVAAEFENYRKRTARDQADFAARANERLVKELLPVLDDLGRALEAAEQHEEAKLEEGVRLVHRQLAELLRKEGLAEIATDGKFDPHVHEALLTQPSEAPEGSVIDVVQKGYTLGDRVLRPARVVVAAAPPEVSAGGDDS